MVTQWIIEIVTGFVSWILSLFPSVGVPVWMSTTVPNALAQVNGYIVSVDVWFPFGAITAGLALVAVALGAAVTIKVVRILASFFTAGGGSAA